MKILLDECLPRKFASALHGHNVTTVADMGWSGRKDRALLRAAHDAQFEAFITIDKNLPFQQNVMHYQFGIIVIDVRRNTLAAMTPLVPQILETLITLRSSEICVIGSS